MFQTTLQLSKDLETENITKNGQKFIPQTIRKILQRDVYTSYKKSLGNNNALAILKSDLQRVNKTIANIMSAIEKGVVTNTTKSRLEELETEQISLHEKIIIEEAKVQYELSKEDIYNFFKFAVNAGTEFCYDLYAS